MKYRESKDKALEKKLGVETKTSSDIAKQYEELPLIEVE